MDIVFTSVTVIKAILAILSFKYWIGEAATEAFTHMSAAERRDNSIIKSGWKWYNSRTGKHEDNKGIFDYHTWRTIEYTGIIGTILYLLWFIYLLSNQLIILVLQPSILLWYVGVTFINWFNYQRLYGYA